MISVCPDFAPFPHTRGDVPYEAELDIKREDDDLSVVLYAVA
jgi:hypothetical protein